MKDEKEEVQNLIVEEVADCDPLTKPTMAPPGGSALGYWVCDKPTKTWVWNDTVA